MAQLKEIVRIDIINRVMFEVWVDEAENYLDDVLSIKGVYEATAKKTRMDVFIDKRYTIDEIVDEVKQLLSGKIPNDSGWVSAFAT